MGLKLITAAILCLTGFQLHAQSSQAMINPQEKSIILIAAFTAGGDLDNLDKSLHLGLDSGLTVNEIKEILVHLYAYTGFPRSLNGINTFAKVTEDRKAQGIEDTQGREATPVEISDKDAYGAKVRALLVGWNTIPPAKGYQVFTPTIDTFLKEHLFADIFARDVLTYQQRELTTISALANMKGAEPQLRAHFNVSLNVGITKEKLQEFVQIISENVDTERGQSSQEILDTILISR